MGLPKIEHPLFTAVVPSSGKEISFRPFTVKEEKILLVAKESKDLDSIGKSMTQILTNCIVSDINISDLFIFDYHYLFMKIRAQSVGDEIEVTVTDPETEEKVDIVLTIDDMSMKTVDKKDTIIDVGGDIKILMSFPKIDDIKVLDAEYENESQKELALFDIMMGCIEKVVDGEEVFVMKNYTREEVDDFIENLGREAIRKIKDFFENMPKTRFEKKYKLKDGKEKTLIIEGTEVLFM